MRGIYEVVLRRTAPTYLRKVRAQVGVKGNEVAEKAAVNTADRNLPKDAKWEPMVETPEEEGTGTGTSPGFRNLSSYNLRLS